jgi:hypothetical protein
MNEGERMKSSTIALILSQDHTSSVLIDILCEQHEIDFLESALLQGEANPLYLIYKQREQQAQIDEELGAYIEELLSQPFLNQEIQHHGVQWLKSKIKIEKYQKSEKEAAQVIAEYAMRIFTIDPTKIDFFLTSQNNQVRVRIFTIAMTTALSTTG